MSTHGTREEELCTYKEGIRKCKAPAYSVCFLCKRWRCSAHLEMQTSEGFTKCQGGCQKVKEETSGKQLEKSA